MMNVQAASAPVQWRTVGPLHSCAGVPAPGESWALPEVCFGGELRATRKASEVYAATAARACGIDTGFVSNVEYGKRVPPREEICSTWIRTIRSANPETMDQLAAFERAERLSLSYHGPLWGFWARRPVLAKAFAAAIKDGGMADRAEFTLASAVHGWEVCLDMASRAGAHMRAPEPHMRASITDNGTMRSIVRFFGVRPRLAAACRRILEAGWHNELDHSVKAFLQAEVK